MRCRKWCFSLVLLLFTIIPTSICGIVPPPWSDPNRNPCANLPGGWQLLYWSPLKQCFKIFTVGYPCPDTMELSPTLIMNSHQRIHNISALSLQSSAAECRCPPGTAINVPNEKCYPIFERGPCENGQYFAPLPDTDVDHRKHEFNNTRLNNNRLGTCRIPKECPKNMIFWPKDNNCYIEFTKGPCQKGNLLVDNYNGIAQCKCENIEPMNQYFYTIDGTCHEHFTKGPCSVPGHIFLPGGECGCNRNLSQYHEENNMCYELNTIGPCARGHVFNTAHYYTNVLETPRGRCQCKDGYISWSDGNCYRLYTRGPCEQNEFLINATTCVRNFCGKSRLYFPEEKTCYRIGSQGPCSMYQVVVFDFMARPSIDGISYNGVCGCSGIITNLNQQCTQSDYQHLTIMMESQCDALRDTVKFNGQCFKLYTRGPCGPGQWLEPIKIANVLEPQILNKKRAKCVCRPGYKPDETHQNRCNAPSVELARYLTIHKQYVLL